MADKNGKIVLDPIYGMIELDALAVKIIDTPCFQRLRYIKQLSVADFVYPGATHTRFAHSIGVYHLACEMIKRIKSQGLSEAVRLTDKEETCIRVAALCHDIGHGPFSHTYEHIFKDELKDVKHEHISVFLVEKMFKDNNNFDLEDEKFDIGLIKDLIQGNYDDYIKVNPKMKEKKYLFQIVSNKTSGMDVDKWDYFNRDAIACGVPERFQFDRALHVAGVFPVKGVYELGYREHDAFSFYNMYNTRLTLHRKVYRHRVVVALELMVNDVFQIVSEANTKPTNSGKELLTIDIFPAKVLTDRKEQEKNISLKSKDGSNPDNKYLMVEDYLKLRDDVLLKIEDSKDERYEKAQTLIRRIHRRKLYKLIEEFKVMNDVEATDVGKEINDIEGTHSAVQRENKATQTEYPATMMKKDLEEWLGNTKLPDDIYIKKKGDSQNEIAGDQTFKEVVRIQVETFDYGKKAYDPVEQMNFYRKGEIKKPKKLERKEVSFVLPSIFQEHYIRVYETFSKNSDYKNDKKTLLQNDLNRVLRNFKVKYQANLVMSRNPDDLPQSNQ